MQIHLLHVLYAMSAALTPTPLLLVFYQDFFQSLHTKKSLDQAISSQPTLVIVT